MTPCSITSSRDRATAVGMLRLNVFAVFRLITKLNLVACITGKSLGALLEAFTPQECANYFANAGYASE